METLYLVIPCYNEELVLDETSHRLQVKMGQLIDQKKITKDSKVVFVNDGSKDKTWEKIVKLHEENSLFAGINLSRNRGHQNALLAGLMTVKEDADMVISMDADLQDDIDVIDQFVAEYYNGNDVVYGVRSSRKQDTFFKRNSALAFYRLMEKMGVQVVYNHADYRLLSKRALQALSEFKEVNLFLPVLGLLKCNIAFKCLLLSTSLYFWFFFSKCCFSFVGSSFYWISFYTLSIFEKKEFVRKKIMENSSFFSCAFSSFTSN